MANAIEVCREFVGHYPAGLNKELDAAYVAARAVLKREEDLKQPWNEEWLRSVGFEVANSYPQSLVVIDAAGLYVGWLVYRDGFPISVGQTRYPGVKTRGDVLRLLDALGIPTKEQV